MTNRLREGLGLAQGHTATIRQSQESTQSLYPWARGSQPVGGLSTSATEPLPSSPQSPAQLVIIHLGLALADTPEPSHLIRVLDDEFPVVPLPGDDTLVLLLLQQLQDKVPQLDLPRAGGGLGLVGPIREGKPWGQEAGGWPQVRAPSLGLWGPSQGPLPTQPSIWGNLSPLCQVRTWLEGDSVCLSACEGARRELGGGEAGARSSDTGRNRKPSAAGPGASARGPGTKPGGRAGMPVGEGQEGAHVARWVGASPLGPTPTPIQGQSLPHLPLPPLVPS